MHDDDRDADYELGLFFRPVCEWSDRELAAGLVALGERIADCQDDGLRPRLTELAAVLAGERDRRRVVYREVQEALNPFTVVSPGRVLRSASERRADRRERRTGG